MKILATDLDRTLLPNGKWKSNKNSINIFNTLIKKNNLKLIYVTGRNLKLVEDAIKKFKINYPDILIGDVGTTIRYYENLKWKKDSAWETYVIKKDKNWNLTEIEKKLSEIKGIKKQENEFQNEFKLSYYIIPENKEIILTNINKLIKGKFSEEIIYSYDPLKNIGLLDILPKHATKKSALIYIKEKFKLTFKEILYAGDSGNDILPLTSGVKGVLVKNGDKQTREKIKENKNIYIAKGDFKGLNGYYTSGIIEGAYHFGFFK